MSDIPPIEPGELGRATPATAPLILDASGRIGSDQPCMNCGYILRGLMPQGVCPECSYPIELSSRGDLIQFAELGWLRRVVRGIGVVLISIVIIFVVSLAAGIALVVLSAAGGMAGAGPSASMLMAVSLVPALPVLVFVVGVWMFTSPDPSREADEKPVSARKLARWLVFASVLSIPLQMLGSSNPMAFAAGGTLSTTDTIVLVISFVTQLVAMIAFVAGLLYLGTLARRIPSTALANQFRIGGWGLGVMQVIILSASALMMLALPSFIAGARFGAPPQPTVVTSTASDESAAEAGEEAQSSDPVEEGATAPQQATPPTPPGTPAQPPTMTPLFLVLAGTAGCGGLLQFGFMIWMLVLVVITYFKLRNIIRQRANEHDLTPQPG